MPLSEFHDQVVAAAIKFCRECDNLGKSMQYPTAPGELMGAACNTMSMDKMVACHKRGECSLVMVDNKSGTMTLQGFVPDASIEASFIETV